MGIVAQGSEQTTRWAGDSWSTVRAGHGPHWYSRWKKDPGLALWMYILLQQEFGWDAFRKVFKEYADLPAAERPRTDQQKRDQWMVRFSKAVKRDLGPYFEVWGVPVTEEARKQVADLTPWMPKRLAELLK